MLKFKFVCCSGFASLLITSMCGSEVTHRVGLFTNKSFCERYSLINLLFVEIGIGELCLSLQLVCLANRSTEIHSNGVTAWTETSLHLWIRGYPL